MLKFASRSFSLILLSLTIASCTHTADRGNMTVKNMGGDFAQYTQAVEVNTKFTDSKWNNRVKPADLRNALRESLDANGLLNTNEPKYFITAEIVGLSAPASTADMRITSQVKYVITDAKTNAVVQNSVIESESRVREKESHLEVKRERMVDEMAMKDNIKQYIESLRK